MMKKRTE
ncbi:hypothetical protein LEMLEM_LOCUS18184 [Lemmus lemmus]